MQNVTLFAVTYQQWKFYNSKYLFYLRIDPKESQIVKYLQDKLGHVLKIVKIVHNN